MYIYIHIVAVKLIENSWGIINIVCGGVFYVFKHSSLRSHPEVEAFFFFGCRHRSSRIRFAISPAAL